MPIDPKLQTVASVVLEKEIYEKIKAVAKRNKRSLTKQIAFWIEEQLAKEELPEERQHSGTKKGE